MAEFSVVSDLLGTLLQIWLKAKAVNDICSRCSAHSARHAMGRHLIEDTGNVAAVNGIRQLAGDTQ